MIDYFHYVAYRKEQENEDLYERLTAVDRTGRRHSLLTADARRLYDALWDNGWDHACFLQTERGMVRKGDLTYVVKP